MKKNNHFALISTYNKEGLEVLCKIFKNYNINIISTDSTSKYILSKGLKCFPLSYFTKSKEMLEGKVKTLNPKLHASLLFDRNNIDQKKKNFKIKFSNY